VENTATNGSSSFLFKPGGGGTQWTSGATGGSHALFPNSFFIYNVNGTSPGAKFLINSAGNIGIGNTNPTAKLHVGAPLSGISASLSSQSAITIGNAGDHGDWTVPLGYSTGGYNIDFQGYRDIDQNQIGARIRGERINNWGSAPKYPYAYLQSMDLAFYTSTGGDASKLTEKVRINSAGDLAIGNPASRGRLTIAAPDRTSNSAIAIRQSNALSYGFDFGLDQSLNGNMYLRMIHNDAVAKENVMVFDRAKGYVGVGVTPTTPFHIAASGYWGSEAWLQIQRRDANESHVGVLLTPSGTLTDINKLWGYGIWGGTNDLRIWNHNGNVDQFILTALSSNGNVGIGTNNPHEKLSVKGTVLAEKVRVSIKNEDWADYVFSKDYKLRSLSSLDSFITKFHHLPDVPSAEEVGKNGLDIGSTQSALLKKIEELTLYMLKQSKEVLKQSREMEKLKREIAVLKSSKY
jgi:hypothetical protein